MGNSKRGTPNILNKANALLKEKKTGLWLNHNNILIKS